MTAMSSVAKEADLMKLALQSSMDLKDHFIDSSKPPFNPENFGSKATTVDNLVQHFNLTGEIQGKTSFLDILKSGRALNREKLCAHLKSVKASLRDVVLYSCSEDISLIAALGSFIRLLGFDVFLELEELRRSNLIENFCEIYGKSFHVLSIIDSSNIKTSIMEHSLKVTGRDAAFSGRINETIVSTLADLCFSTLLLTQAFRRGIYDEDTLFRDYCQRVSSVEVNGNTEVVSMHLLKETFEKTKKSMHIYFHVREDGVFESKSSNSPSFLFAKTCMSASVDWSFRDFQTLTDNTVVLTSNALYFFSSVVTTKPAFCIPLAYVRVDQEDANGSIMHISSIESDVVPVINYSESASSVYYVSSIWIEFSTSAALLSFSDKIEVLIEELLK